MAPVTTTPLFLMANSIQKDPKNPLLFTNRAFSRIKLQSWDASIDDCLKAIELQSENMKAYYYLAQAQLALHHPNEALTSALTAYSLCLKSNNASAPSISSLVLQSKKEKWEAKEKERIRMRSELLLEVEESLNHAAAVNTANIDQKLRYHELDMATGTEEKEEIRTASRRKIEELRSVFAIADPVNLKRRVE